MAIKATFVGVNKHLDALIPELSGARHDAMALWALFTDTIEGLAARLLFDEAATYSEVSQAILGTLSAADEDDVVVASFAGHGSPDGNLVLYDTSTADLAGTALPMTVLADAFKETKARVVLCILDCCFSGQAPARVLEPVARPRSAFALTGIYGEGRILLAACVANESAWEQPGTGHGLLTYAAIKALTKAKGESVSFPEIAGEIIRLTRVEAERRRNADAGVLRERARWPDLPGAQARRQLRRGASRGLEPPDVGVIRGVRRPWISAGNRRQWTAHFPQGLNALQLKAVNEHGVLDGKSMLVVAPTSSGKTLIGEVAAIQAVTMGKKGSLPPAVSRAGQ